MAVSVDQAEAQHQMWKVFQIWQTFQIWWYRMLTKQPCPLEEPGVLVGQAHAPHATNWWMGGGTYDPINKPYDITAAPLESTYATASSPV